MKKSTLLALLLVLVGSSGFSQVGQWTWMKGKSEWDTSGVYGTKGVADPANTPRQRNSGASWTDANGDFWLFGGEYFPGAFEWGYLNDLWKYSVATNQWTWVSGDKEPNHRGVYGTQGAPHDTNKPGARDGCAGWTDAADNLWLFGGHGNAASTYGPLNDLWKYDQSTGLWTWMKGDSTAFVPGVYGEKGIPHTDAKPGGRRGSVSWTDEAGNLWLLGGAAYTENTGWIPYNDLWKCNPATNKWTWVSGDNTPSQPGVYGEREVPAAANKPGARYNSSGWKDAAGNLWLFGGYGLASNSTYGHLNDLWKYSITTNQWTWMKGDNYTGRPGIYGTQGIPHPDNKPGPHASSATWTDAQGNFWLCGGGGAETSFGYSNDLWRYNPITKEWTWMYGHQSGYYPPVYGQQGVASPTNDPGGRLGSFSWTDVAGNLWLFSGSMASDLWKYTLSATTPVVSPGIKPFTVTIAPNPSTQHFLLNIESRNNRLLEITIHDAEGRLVEKVQGARANGSIQLGQAYGPGVYYAEVVQGREKMIVQMVKL